MSAATPPPDARVGPYLLLARIGEGGMGLVYLARSPEGRRVALKVLRPHIVGDDEARDRLAREVSSLRRVCSPRVAEVIDADPWGETPYVATRYVPGLSLHQHVRRHGPVEGDDLRWFAAGLAEAVVAVHDVGVLHRDVKPSNVLLEGRSPVLIDFGLARVAEDPRLTGTGWLLGTPGYLAPEILYGEDATVASDVHAWAATVAFAATGRPPFGTGPALAIMDRVRRGEHDLIGVPEDLLPLLEQGMAPDPQDRPGTAAVLAALRTPSSDDTHTVRLAQGVRSEPTMPMMLAEAPDDDLTDLVDATHLAEPDDPWVEEEAEWPEEPRELEEPAEWPVSALPPVYARGSRLRQGSLLVAMFALVVAGFARAPYLALAPLAGAVLLLRTASWTSESARDRKWRRGRSRWYDGPLTAMSTPWYLLVASAGTLLLMCCSALLAFVAGAGYLLFRPLPGPTLAVMGAVLALTVWCGPGSRRVREPTRALVGRLSVGAWSTRVVVLLLLAGTAMCGYQAATHGVDWAPWTGSPWAPGTVLGGLLGT